MPARRRTVHTMSEPRRVIPPAMSEHKTEQKPPWTPSISTQRIALLFLIVSSAAWIAVELFDFELPRSLVGIGLFSVVIGTSLYQLRQTYRPEASKTEPGRLQRMTSFGISQETVKGRLLLFAAWWGIGLLVAGVLIMLFG